MSQKKAASPGKNSRKIKDTARRSGLPLWAIAMIVLILVAGVGALVLRQMGSTDRQVSTAGDKLPSNISVEQAYELYQGGAFVLDVRTQEEWDDYHAPDTTLIPLDQLESRLAELPKDQPIVVVCRSGNRSQQGRDILLEAGFDATSVDGGLSTWRSAGYPVE